MGRDRKVFNLKSFVIALVGICLGLGLVIITENIDKIAHPIGYAITASIAATLLTAGLLGLGYELILRKELMDEFGKSTAEIILKFEAMSADISDKIDTVSSNFSGRLKLSSGVDVVGLQQIGIRESHFDYTNIIGKSKKLYFVFNDGRTWFSNHHDDLFVRSQNKDFETHIILVHPSSEFIDALAQKVDQTSNELRAKISETVKLISRISWGDHKVIIHGHMMPTSYSLVMNEEFAVYIPYPMARKMDKIPCFIFKAEKEDGFYHTLRRDVEALIGAESTKIIHPPHLFQK